MIKRMLLTITFLLMFGLLSIWVWLTEPYITKEYSRLSEIEEIKTNYAGWACGPNSPQLTPFILNGDGTIKYTDEPFLLSLATGVPNPEDSVAGIPGNNFILWAYREKVKQTNIVTGSTTQKISPRLYVVGWAVETPYHIYGPDSQRVEKNEPIKYFVSSNKLASLSYKRLKQLAC